MTDFEHLKRIASQVRRDIVRMVHARQSGHPGGSLGCTDLMTLLYFDHLRIKAPAFDMNGTGEDIFFLSNGHISPVFYSVLARKGYFSVSELATFRAIESRLQGHPTTHEGLPGVRMSSGSLGQGLSVAIGAANTKKLNNDKHLVYVLMGDGEQQEGQVWEAAMYAGSRKIDNIIAMIDYNHKQIDGPVDEVMPLGDLKAKYEAFGWKVIEVDGNHMEALSEQLENCRNNAFHGFPQMILMKTEMGQGVDFMMGTHKWHGIAPNDEQLEKALSQLEETLGDY